MFPAKSLVMVAWGSIVLGASPSSAQSGSSRYWDSIYGQTFRNIDGANDDLGLVVGIVERGYDQALVSFRRNSLPYTTLEPVFFGDVSIARNTLEVLASGSVTPVQFQQAVVLPVRRKSAEPDSA